MGSESIFEDLAHKLNTHPSNLLALVSKDIQQFEQTKAKYLDDLLHKIILCELGVKQINIYKFEELNIDTLVKKLRGTYCFLTDMEGLADKANYLLHKHHRLSFLNKPLIRLESQHLTVGQVYHG